MAEIQWIKLKVDMFDNEKIKLIEAMPDADSILVIWIKLLTYAGKANSSGYILLTENIPMNEEELATIFNRPLNTIRYALQIFERYGMVERENDAIRIKNWDMHQNIEGMEKIKEQNRLRKQKQREKNKKKLSEPPEKEQSHVMSRDSHATEEEKEEELDKNIDIDKDKETDTEKERVGVIFDKYTELGFGAINAFKAEQITEHLKTFEPEVIIKSLEVASNNNKATMNYVNGILNNWKQRELTTLEKVEAEEKKKQLEQMKPSFQQRRKEQPGEKLPDWIDKAQEKPKADSSEPVKTAAEDPEIQKMINEFRNAK